MMGWMVMSRATELACVCNWSGQFDQACSNCRIGALEDSAEMGLRIYALGRLRPQHGVLYQRSLRSQWPIDRSGSRSACSKA